MQTEPTMSEAADAILGSVPTIDNPPREHPEDAKAEAEEEKQAEAEEQEREEVAAIEKGEIRFSEMQKLTITIRVNDDITAVSTKLINRKVDGERVLITARKILEGLALKRFTNKYCGPQLEEEPQVEMSFESQEDPETNGENDSEVDLENLEPDVVVENGADTSDDEEF